MMEGLNLNKEKSKKKPFSLESIRKHLNKGRVFLLSTIIALSSIKGDFNEEHIIYAKNDLSDKFKNVTQEKESSIHDDLTKILTQEEITQYSEQDSIMPEFLVNESIRQNIVKLDEIFDISIEDLNIIEFATKERELTSFLENSKNWDLLLEIRKKFPKDEIPNIRFLPITSIEKLNNPEYVKGLDMLAELGLVGRNFIMERDIVEIGQNDYFFKILKKITEAGAHIDFSIFEAKSIDFLEELEKLTTSSKNMEVFKYSKDSSIGVSEMITLVNQSNDYWVGFFEKLENKETIEKLKKQGYTFSSFLALGENFATKINQKEYTEMLTEFSKVVSLDKIDIGQLRWFLGYLQEYYNLDNKEDVQKVISALKGIKESTADKKLFHSNIGQLSDALMEDFKKDAGKNIFDNLLKDSQGYAENKEDFLGDPALRIIFKLNYQKDVPSYLECLSERERAEWLMRTARNMYISNKEINAQNFEQTFFETMELRTNKKIINQSLFKDRNIALFAHNQKWEDGSIRFGTDSAQKSIRKQNPRSLDVFRAGQTLESLDSTKNNFMKYIENKQNLTIIFEAHGSPGSVSLTEGIPQKDGSINMPFGDASVNSSELAKSLTNRFDNGYSDRVIIMMGSCYNQDYIRNLCEELISLNETRDKKVPIPICLGDTEYRQYSFSDDVEYGSLYLKALLECNTDTKIKDVIELEAGQSLIDGYNRSGVISIFVPIFLKNKFQNGDKKQLEIFYQIAEGFDKSPDFMNSEVTIDQEKIS